ncbi:POK19 protein, partial [Ciccaba nigrolineata]|nr:POK19 protein [Ciccaba nigrolineata]
EAWEDNEIWQTDVTHISLFGCLQWVHVTVDTFSGMIHVTAASREKVIHIQSHWLSCFVNMGVPKEIKTHNRPGSTAHKIQLFLQQWGIWHKTGIPHKATGQAIVK